MEPVVFKDDYAIVNHRLGGRTFHHVVDLKKEKIFVEEELPTKFNTVKEFSTFIRALRKEELWPCRYQFMLDAAKSKGINIDEESILNPMRRYDQFFCANMYGQTQHLVYSIMTHLFCEKVVVDTPDGETFDLEFNRANIDIVHHILQYCTKRDIGFQIVPETKLPAIKTISHKPKHSIVTEIVGGPFKTIFRQVVDANNDKFVAEELPKMFSTADDVARFVYSLRNVDVWPCRFSSIMKAAIDKGIDLSSEREQQIILYSIKRYDKKFGTKLYGKTEALALQTIASYQNARVVGIDIDRKVFGIVFDLNILPDLVLSHHSIMTIHPASPITLSFP